MHAPRLQPHACAQALDLSRCVRVEHLTFHHSSHSLLELQLGACMHTACMHTACMCTACMHTACSLAMPHGSSRCLTVPHGAGHCAQLSRDAISAIAESCEALLALALLACAQLDDALLLELGTGCTRLQRLHLQHSRTVPPPPLLARSSPCAQPPPQGPTRLLLRLPLGPRGATLPAWVPNGGCGGALCAYPRWPMPRPMPRPMPMLMPMLMPMPRPYRQCELISERGAFYAATSCRELRELRLCGCVQLTDEEALQATHGCSSLCALELPSGKMADLLAGII